MSLTEMVSSLIWRSRRITSRWRKNISPSSPYHLSKYCWQIFLRSGVMNPFFLAILMCVVLCAKKQTTGSCTSCSVESRERSDFYFGCGSEQSSWLLLS